MEVGVGAAGGGGGWGGGPRRGGGGLPWEGGELGKHQPRQLRSTNSLIASRPVARSETVSSRTVACRVIRPFLSPHWALTQISVALKPSVPHTE